MFGPEASGLSNDDISFSNYIFKIPVDKKFQSLNLSHCVTIICYEIFKMSKPTFAKKEKNYLMQLIKTIKYISRFH